MLLIGSSRIRNPLVGIPTDELLQDVETFARGTGLSEHEALLKKGALVAQSPKKFDEIEELDDEDRRYLHQEVEHRWRQPKLLYFTIFLNSVAAAIQGWDQTGEPTSRTSICFSSKHKN